MAFDSTISGANANSYIPVATADAYFAFHLDGEQYWNNLPVAKKQAALVQATNRIDMETFGGRPTQDYQRLQFPRSFVVDRNKDKNQEMTAEFIGGAFYRPSDVIWKEVADATCEMALFYLKSAAGELTVSDDELETVSSMKVGPLDYTIKSNVKGDRLPHKVKALLMAIGPNGWMGGRPLTYDR